jgi:hypothetical protein
VSERETLTYELFGTAARELAEQVAADGYSPTSSSPSPAAGCSSAARWATPSTSRTCS